MKRLAGAALLCLLASMAEAHRAPNSFVRLDIAAHAVRAQMLVPQSELAYALPGEPGPRIFADYLLQHVAIEDADGARWKIEVRSVRSTRYSDHDYIVAELVITPPAGVRVGDFVLVDDAVTHEVRSHVVIITQRGKEDRLLGQLQYPARRLTVGRQ
ncbi:MAG: hypothetical protein ABI769_12915 [Pseudomonadota bacterium]